MQEDQIEVIGAKEHNLKNINVVIPKNKLVVFAGVSGSGKSSLVFDTIARESSRQWQDSYPLFVLNKLPHFDRPQVDEIRQLPPSIVIDQKSLGTNVRSAVGTAMDISPLIRLLFSRVGVPSAGGSMAYNSNHPEGMCPVCTGLGTVYKLSEDALFNVNTSLSEGGGILFSQFDRGWQAHLYQNNPLLHAHKLLKDFSEEEWDILLHGSQDPIKIDIRSNNTGRVEQVPYEGVIPRFYRLYLNRDITKLKQSLQDEILSFVIPVPCEHCNGTGLHPNALASKINNYNIVDFMNTPVNDVLPLLESIESPLGQAISIQIKDAIERMIRVGIEYLALSRKTDTLSGGELQRIKIVPHLGASLSNVNYIFDEPTVGLHPHDADKIGQLLLELRDKYNNILVVEHNRHIISLADEIIELGPSAGKQGGQIVFQGTLDDMKRTDSFISQSMNSKIQVNENPLPWNEGFIIEGACANSLKHINVTIPKGVLTAITGVAGSGKSSLMTEAFIPRNPNRIVIDQKQIGTSIRSTPATYVGIMDEIRKIFAKENCA